MWVTPEEVLNRWTGTDDIPDENDITLATLIDDAEAVIALEVAGVSERLLDGTLDSRLLKMVVSNVVQRAWQSKQDGKLSYAYGSGPFNESGSYGNTRRGIYLEPEERALITKKGTNAGAFMISLDNNPSIINHGIYGPNAWLPGRSDESWYTPYER